MIKAKIVSAEKVANYLPTYKLKLTVEDSHPEEFIYAYVGETQIDGISSILNPISRRVTTAKSYTISSQDYETNCQKIINQLIGLSAHVHMNERLLFVQIRRLRVSIACIRISNK